MEWSRGQILGRGSTATVFAANSSSGDIFAVKSVELSRSELLQREQKFLSNLSNPHLVSYMGYDITSENNKLMYNIFIEYMPGGTLSDTICKHEMEVAKYTRQILRGLEYLHSAGIMHCDIKGRNILINESGAKIADLGCAKWANEVAPFGGTPMFMAPEVARGEEQGFPADIWALGCTVIEMARSGGSPWPNINDPMSVLYRIAYSDEIPEIPYSLSDRAKDFLSKCLRRDGKERWTATQLLKHPFLEESTKETGQDFVTDSPTSILDRGIWGLIEEETEHSVRDMGEKTCSPGQRIKQLADNSQMSWRWGEEDEITSNWITVRGHNGNNNNKMVVVVDGDGLSLYQEEIHKVSCCCRCNNSCLLMMMSYYCCTCCIDDIKNNPYRTSVDVVGSFSNRQKQPLLLDLDQYQFL